MADLETRIRRAWEGRISGCMLGKPVEILSMREGHAALAAYLGGPDAAPLRDYIEFKPHPRVTPSCCRGHMSRSEPDDDINYSLLALILLEKHGLDLSTADVARAWLQLLPAGKTYTAERAAYAVLLSRGKVWFAEGGEAGFDLSECSDNPYNDWIGAQIRADVYGWVSPGRPERAAALARVDANLSHRGEGVHGAVFVAALAAALAASAPDAALEQALAQIPSNSEAAAAVRFGRSLAGRADGDEAIRAKYDGLSPVHTINNLAIVIWALYSHLDDFGAAIGDAVAAGLDTDCNGATVGGLWGVVGGAIPAAWTTPWAGRVGVSLAGHDEVSLSVLVKRTAAVCRALDAT
jgi:ADP-ribosylglycohydrolase